MKPNFTAILAGLGLTGFGLSGHAQYLGPGGQPTSTPGAPAGSSYINYDLVTNPPVINAVNFVNLGTFDISTVLITTNTITVAQEAVSAFPFTTSGTENWTNENIMIGSPGFHIQTASGGKIKSAASFVNTGQMTGLDTPGLPYFQAINGN